MIAQIPRSPLYKDTCISTKCFNENTLKSNTHFIEVDHYFNLIHFLAIQSVLLLI